MTIGMYAGSFDPLHLGHLGVITRAARWCDTLFVVAAGNPDKCGGLFDRAERRRLVEASTGDLDNVIALEHGGLLVELAVRHHVDVLIRGAGKEQAVEFEMAVANAMAGGPPTVFLPPVGATVKISSTRVRKAYARGGVDAIVDLVPPAVVEALARRRADQPSVTT